MNKSISTQQLPLSNALKEIVKILMHRGAAAEVLPDTEVVILKYHKREYYFIGDYLPIIPHNVGLILTNPEYVEAILKDRGIPYQFRYFNNEYKQVHEWSVYMDNSGWMQIKPHFNQNLISQNKESVADTLKSVLSINPSDELVKKIRQMSLESLKAFYPIPYITLGLALLDNEKSENTPELVITKVGWQLDDFIPGTVFSENRTKSQAEALADIFDQVTV